MDIFFFEGETANFGDDLNMFLWDALLPGCRSASEDVTLFGVGTILADKFVPEGRVLVVGSGTGYSRPPDVLDTQKWDVRAVRGPRTAKALGLPADKAFIDPAVMLPTLPQFAEIEKNDEVLFIPHFRTLPHLDWNEITRKAGVSYQAPSDPCEQVVRRIAGARAVIAESMHAAIIADAFNVPWLSVEIGEKFNRFKWGDWQESVGYPVQTPYLFFSRLHRTNLLRKAAGKLLPSQIAPKPKRLADLPEATLQAVLVKNLRNAAAGQFHLTDRDALKMQRNRMTDLLQTIRADYRLG